MFIVKYMYIVQYIYIFIVQYMYHVYVNIKLLKEKVLNLGGSGGLDTDFTTLDPDLDSSFDLHVYNL